MKRGWWILKAIVFGLLMVTLVSFATLWLWNWLVPDLFGGPVLTFWKALGLLALIKILFWSVGKGGHWGNHNSGPWRPYWKAKWDSISPEDRARFKEKMKDKWCQPRQESQDVNSGG